MKGELGILEKDSRPGMSPKKPLPIEVRRGEDVLFLQGIEKHILRITAIASIWRQLPLRLHVHGFCFERNGYDPAYCSERFRILFHIQLMKAD